MKFSIEYFVKSFTKLCLTVEDKEKRKVDQEVPEKVLALTDESQKVEVIGNIDSLDWI